jgi:hypothetical protein
MIRMPDIRRRTPEPLPAGAPDIQFKPGMADELLRELAPLLAEEGIDVSNIDVPDLVTLQQALSRAVERHNMAATVAGCIGLTLGLLDQWLSGHDTSAPPGLAGLIRLPAGHWTGEHAARDILTLARKGRAFGSFDAPIARQGGQAVLYGSALILAAAPQAWARHTSTPFTELARTAVRKADTIPAISGQCCDDRWNPPAGRPATHP